MSFVMKSAFVMRNALVLLLALAIGIYCTDCDDAQTVPDWIVERTSIYIGELVEVESWDNHHEVECGGLFRPFPEHYDGDSLDVFECDAEAFKAIEADWCPLPLPENLNKIVYGGYVVDSPLDIPEIEEGSYLFIDRHDEAVDPSDESRLFDRASIDLSLFLYDAAHSLLYYYELDT